jgi:hypothetical protein
LLKMFYAMSKKSQDRFDTLRALDKKASKKWLGENSLQQVVQNMQG